MPPRVCAVSVDLDEAAHYFSIHGLPVPAGLEALAYTRALPRLCAFARSRALPLTLFAVGADALGPTAGPALRAAVEAGHAVESHSFSHRYDLTRLAPGALANDLGRSLEAIEGATGVRPTGFRAPGYTVTDALFDVLEELELDFDASVFPCPPYYLAKAAAMGLIALRGRASKAILDTPRVMFAPTRPYRPGRHWASVAPGPPRRFVELPVQVVPDLRLPFIGTALGLAGPTLAGVLARACVGEPLVSLELHAMDFLEVGDGLEALAPHQPELRTPLARRVEALTSALDMLARHGYSFVRLDEAAARSV